MGDMADYQFDDHIMAIAAHQNGDCDEGCPVCREEEEDKKRRDRHKRVRRPASSHNKKALST